MPRCLLWGPPLLALLVHAPSLSHGFIADDLFVLLDDPQITRPTPLRELLLADWFNRGGVEAIGHYRPAIKASFRATCALVGPSALAFHLTN